MDTHTIKPSYLSIEEHTRAESDGWSIFEVSSMIGPRDSVQRIDELEILTSDDEAIELARKMGLVVLEDGYVLARWREEVDGLHLDSINVPLPRRDDGTVDLGDEHLVEGLKGILQRVDACDIGALTDGLVLSREVQRSDETGQVLKVGDVFWDDDYAVRNFWDVLDQKGTVRIRRVK